jgi:hypothetical protein
VRLTHHEIWAAKWSKNDNFAAQIVDVSDWPVR